MKALETRDAKIQFRLNSELKERFKNFSEKTGEGMTAIFESLLVQKLTQEGF